MNQAPFRSDIVVAVRKDCRPDGAEIYFGFGFYKDAAPDGAGNRCHKIQFGLDEWDIGRLNMSIKAMKLKILFMLAALIGILGLNGCKPNESEYDRYNREAHEEMLRFCTNNIVGLNHFISIDLRHFITDSKNKILDGDINDPHTWEGNIVAEYVNHVGGIDRTNIVFRFTLETNEYRNPKICVALDYHLWDLQEAAKMKTEQEDWLKSLKNK
jgi:hypothetical protein